MNYLEKRMFLLVCLSTLKLHFQVQCKLNLISDIISVCFVVQVQLNRLRTSHSCSALCGQETERVLSEWVEVGKGSVESVEMRATAVHHHSHAICVHTHTPSLIWYMYFN